MAKPRTVDAYLAALDDVPRRALQRVRETIAAAVPDADECISYDMPAFRLEGTMFVSYAAAKRHCALYIGVAPIEQHRDELAAYDLTKGAIRFQPDKPIPLALIRKLVKTRITTGGPRRARRGTHRPPE